MPLEIKPIHKLTYKLRLTPQMRLAINLLQMPMIKLKELIEQEVEKNPLLDMETVKGPSDRIRLSSESYNLEDEEKENYKKTLITKPLTLAEHLLRQLHLLTDSEDDCKIGELIIGNINDDGYLGSSVDDIVESNKIRKSQVERLLMLIQTFDPIGVGARDLRECLLLQLRAKGDLSAVAERKSNSAKAEESSLAGQVVDKYLPYLEKKRFDYVAKKLKVSVERIKEALKEIANLEPKPGRSFNAERTVRLIPDATLRKNKDGYEVILNDWELPHITINDKYKKMIKQKQTPEDAKKYLRERLKAACTLIDAVKRRKDTIQKVIEEIVHLQKDFLDKGVVNLKPMTLERIAKGIGKHKSTVSRAVTNKYLQTPHGIFELRSFLSSGIKQVSGELLSSKTIKSRIADLISKEDKGNPLSDQKIVDHLQQDGISISRRAVAKYRNQLKILSSKSRQD